MKPLPPGVDAALVSAGGVNRFGQPNYRCVWGQDRMEWIGGEWRDHDAAGTLLRSVFEARWVRRYAQPLFVSERWYLEKWIPPEQYGTPESWERSTKEYFHGSAELACGSYPSRGDYEHIFTIAGPATEAEPQGSFLQVTAEIVRLAVKLNQINSEKTPSERRRDKMLAEEREQKLSAERTALALDEVPILRPSREFTNLVRRMAHREGILAHIDDK